VARLGGEAALGSLFSAQWRESRSLFISILSIALLCAEERPPLSHTTALSRTHTHTLRARRSHTATPTASPLQCLAFTGAGPASPSPKMRSSARTSSSMSASPGRRCRCDGGGVASEAGDAACGVRVARRWGPCWAPGRPLPTKADRPTRRRGPRRPPPCGRAPLCSAGPVSCPSRVPTKHRLCSTSCRTERDARPSWVSNVPAPAVGAQRSAAAACSLSSLLSHSSLPLFLTPRHSGPARRHQLQAPPHLVQGKRGEEREEERQKNARPALHIAPRAHLPSLSLSLRSRSTGHGGRRPQVCRPVRGPEEGAVRQGRPDPLPQPVPAGKERERERERERGGRAFRAAR